MPCSIDDMKTAARLILLLLMLSATTVTAKRVVSFEPATEPAMRTPMLWMDDIDAALTLASVEYRPVLVVFSSPHCPWCIRLKKEVWADPEVEKLLEHFCLVEINTEKDEITPLKYQVQGVPTVLVLSADGRVHSGFAGFAAASQVAEMLGRVLIPEIVKQSLPDHDQLLKLVDQDDVPAEKWPDVVVALGVSQVRDELRSAILRLDPLPRKHLVSLLEHSRLAVRLGAIDVLEELAGTTFDFDPWLDEAVLQQNRESLQVWRQWAADTNCVESVYSALTAETVTGYIRDLVSGDRERSVRAIRMLEHGGEDAALALAEFLEQHADLPRGARNRIREVQYALYLPSLQGIDRTVIAHRLVFGNMDVRLKSIEMLKTLGRQALPVLSEFLDDPDAVVRETAVDTLVTAGGRYAIPLLQGHLEREQDADVLYAVLQGLGEVRTRGSLQVLISFLSHENEDLVAAALGSIAKLKSHKAGEAVIGCLKDRRWRVRSAALDTVSKLKLTDAADTVAAMLEDEDDFVRYGAVQALAAISAKTAAGKLEEVFLKDNELKGPVVAAFGSLDLDIPESFDGALKGEGAEVLLPVIEALAGCDEHGVKLAARFMNHPDLDVACAAIRLVAKRGAKFSEYRQGLVDALRAEEKEKRLAALESIRVDADMPYVPGYSSWAIGDMDFADEFGMGESWNTVFQVMGRDAAARDRSSGVDLASGAETSIVDDVLEAFLDESPPAETEEDTAVGQLPTNVSPQSVAPADAEEAPAVDDLFAAFDAPVEPQPASADSRGDPASHSKAGLEDLFKAVAANLESEDESIRFAAAILMAQMRNPKALPILQAGLADRNAKQRVDVARSIAAIPDGKALPTLRALLLDPSEDVRETAVVACLSINESSAGIDAVFEELLSEGSPLKPNEVCEAVLSRVGEQAGARKHTRSWAQKIIESEYPPSMKTFALITLSVCWRSEDAKMVEQFFDSKDPYQRRAAFYTLGRNDPQRFEKTLDKILADSSEEVRLVMPAVYGKNQGRWVHYVDGTNLVSRGYHYSSSLGRISRLRSKARESLLALTEDPSPKVRVEAYFCLLDYRQRVDLAHFIQALDLLPDRKAIGDRVASYMSSNYQQLGPGFHVLLPYLKDTAYGERTLERIRGHFGFKEEDETELFSLVKVVRREAPDTAPATFTEPEDAAPDTKARRLKVVYFSSPGCSDCDRVAGMLNRMREHFPAMELETQSVRKIAAMRRNEALCEKFRVPEKIRGVAPAVFAGAGYLVKQDISVASLGDLLSRSTAVPLEDWYVVDQDNIAEADSAIGERYAAFGLGVVILAGLVDSVNPCAFATIIFFLSYLHVTRRRPGEIAQVALAFIAGVFLAYFTLGIGLVELIAKLEIFSVTRRILNLGMAAFAFVIMVLSVRDGMLCLLGRIDEITLQLPGILKDRIHGVIRKGARQTRFVVAAFVVGILISFLELACTGQVYLPTIHFMLKAGGHTLSAVTYLLVYNLAFILPLVVIFLLAMRGMTSTTLTRVLRERAALVKFLTALLFLIIFLALVGSSLSLF